MFAKIQTVLHNGEYRYNVVSPDGSVLGSHLTPGSAYDSSDAYHVEHEKNTGQRIITLWGQSAILPIRLGTKAATKFRVNERTMARVYGFHILECPEYYYAFGRVVGRYNKNPKGEFVCTTVIATVRKYLINISDIRDTSVPEYVESRIHTLLASTSVLYDNLHNRTIRDRLKEFGVITADSALGTLCPFDTPSR